MTAEEFVKKFYTEKTEQLKNSFDFETDKRNTTSYEIEKLNLDELQLDKLRLGISQLLTDNYYTILLGLDGSATIGEGNQETMTGSCQVRLTPAFFSRSSTIRLPSSFFSLSFVINQINE